MEQIVRLLGRAQKKADARKETTQQVGTKVNHYQSKLRELTCKMMAHISELSVQQVRGRGREGGRKGGREGGREGGRLEEEEEEERRKK